MLYLLYLSASAELLLSPAGSKDVKPVVVPPRAARKSGLWQPVVVFRPRFAEMTGRRQVEVCRRFVLR